MKISEANIAFVVHSFPPFQGGSENYVYWMAKECQNRGAKVTVYAGNNKGNYDGIYVTDDFSKCVHNNGQKIHDLIVVHGSGVSYQDSFLRFSPDIERIGNKILFLPILPRNSHIENVAIKYCSFFGASTPLDEELYYEVKKYRETKKTFPETIKSKMQHVPHGIKLIDIDYLKIISKNITPKIFREKLQINPDSIIYYSGGGYWPNKGHIELAETFNSLANEKRILIVSGYGGDSRFKPQTTDFVKCIDIENPEHVYLYMMYSDAYIMSSKEEGFGLTLLEAAYLEKPILTTNIAGAKAIKLKFPDFRRSIYFTDLELRIKNGFENSFFNPYYLKVLCSHVKNNHLISNTVEGIQNCLI